MKLLLDQNISRRLIPKLEPYFEGSTQVALIGLDKSSDIELWEYARANEFIIVTKDSDFEELSIKLGSPPKVIWIKSGNVNNDFILKVLTDNREHIKNLLSHSEVSCIEIY